jgi:hypothetical protein
MSGWQILLPVVFQNHFEWPLLVVVVMVLVSAVGGGAAC